jgi:hypothetical protein
VLRHAYHQFVTWGREGYDDNDVHSFGYFDADDRCGCDDGNTDGLVFFFFFAMAC